MREGITRSWVIPGASAGKQKQFFMGFPLLKMCDCMKCRYLAAAWSSKKLGSDCSFKMAVRGLTSAGWQFANWSCLSETAVELSTDSILLAATQRAKRHLSHGIPVPQISGLLKTLNQPVRMENCNLQKDCRVKTTLIIFTRNPFAKCFEIMNKSLILRLCSFEFWHQKLQWKMLSFLTFFNNRKNRIQMRRFLLIFKHCEKVSFYLIGCLKRVKVK